MHRRVNDGFVYALLFVAAIVMIMVVFFAATSAYAQTVDVGEGPGKFNLSWQAPTEFTDGSSLSPEDDLEGYGVYLNGERIAVAQTTQYEVTGVGYGEAEFFVTAIAKNGFESAMSNTVVRIVPDTRVPKPPTLLDVILAFLADIVRKIGEFLV